LTTTIINTSAPSALDGMTTMSRRWPTVKEGGWEVAGYSGKVGKWCCGHGFMTGSNVVDVSLPCESNEG